jgi:RecA-family ATPase
LADSTRSQFLFDFLNEKIKQPPSIIGRGVLPVQSKMVIGGRPKQGKSFFAINIALDLSRGRPLFGAKFPGGQDVFPVHQKHRVLYIEKEIGRYSLKERLLHMTQGMTIPEIEFFLIPRSSEIRLDKGANRDIVEAEIAALQPKVVILDPFSKFHGNDENSAQEMGTIMRVMDTWMERYGCSFIIVHHIGHQDPKFERKGGDALRGSTAIYGDIDTVILHKRMSAEHIVEPTVKLEFEIRHGEPLEPLMFRRRSSGIYEYLGDAPETKEERVLPEEKVKDDLQLLEERSHD